MKEDIPEEKIGLGERSDPTPDAEHRPHDWPVADENWCSCCRGRIMHGLENVLHIRTSPEKIVSMEGMTLGEDNRKPADRAFLHARCAKIHFGLTVECEKCGILSKAKTLSNGAKNECKCNCHTGGRECSYILEPNAVNNQIVRKLHAR